MTRSMRSLCAAAVLTVAASYASAGGPSFTSTWKDPDAKATTFKGKKVITLFMSPDEALRRGVEMSMTEELNKRGIVALPAYSIVPTETIKDEAKAKELIMATGAAGVVTMRLVGRDQEVSGSAGGYYATPYASGMWGGYWGYGWGGVYDPGYLRTDTVVHVEILVHSLEQNKLIWAAQSKATNPKSSHALVRDLVKKSADMMKKQGLIAQ